MTVSAIRMADGTEISSTDATCEGCGNPLADHSCGGTGATTSVTYSRSGKGTTRKKPDEKPPCVHCGAPMHFNYGASAVNGACINMQYAVDKGEVTDPVHQKAPVLTAERWIEIGEWLGRLATPITYGDMVTAAGGVGTYSSLRGISTPKTGRKKKAVAAAAGSRIEDLADEVVVDDGEAPDPKAKKGKKSKGRKPKVNEPFTLVVDEDGETAHAEAIEVATNGHAEAVVDFDEDDGEAPDPIEEAPAPVQDEDAARAERAARRAERKAKLASLGKR